MTVHFSHQDCHIAAMAKLFESIGKLGLALAIGGGVVNSALYNGKFSAALLPNVPDKKWHNWFEFPKLLYVLVRCLFTRFSFKFEELVV